MRRIFLSLFLSPLFLFCCSACKAPAEKRVPELISNLSSPNDSVKNKAALELAYYEEDAKAAVPALIKLLRHPHNGIKSAAAFALQKIGTPEAREAINQAKERR